MFDGSVMRDLRLRNNLTANALATMLGVSRSYINHIESGRRQPQLNHQKQLADIFKVSVNYFYKKQTAVENNEPETQTQMESTTPISEQLSTAAALVLSIPMLFSMIHGAQLEIETTVCSGKPFQVTRSIHGQLEGSGLVAESNCFDLTITSTEIVLWLKTQKPDWLEACKTHCGEPDVHLSDTKEFPAEQYEQRFLWFTPYMSVYDQIMRCIQLKKSDTKMTVTNSDLSSYVFKYEVYHHGATSQDVTT